MTSSPLTPEQALQAARRGTGGPFSFCPPAWQAAENPWIPRFSAVFASVIHRKNVCSERLILDDRTLLWQRFLACVRSEEHTSALQSLMRISYAVFCLKQKRPQIDEQPL